MLKRDGMNLCRIWCMGYPTAPQRLIQPWQRSTTGTNALDGLKKWDLNTWDEAYFTRLKAIAQAASDRGIVVEFTFFSVLYDDTEWRRSPFHASNNVQGYGSATNRFDCLRQNSVNALLFERQMAAVKRIVRELNGFDNVYYEIQNEPWWNEPGVKDSEEVAFQNSHARRHSRGRGHAAQPPSRRPQFPAANVGDVLRFRHPQRTLSG